ncbi:hypothetical protein D3C76_836450 [compost metagenome]
MAIGAELRQAGVHLLHVGDQVGVGEHRALGHAGGAAGVLQHGDVVEADPDRLQGMAAPLLQGLLERHRRRQAVVRHHLLQVFHRQVDQPALRLRQQVAHARLDQVFDAGVRQHFLDQLAEQVDVDQRPRPGILELVAHLAGGIERIGVDHHQPGAQRAEHRHRELQDIRHLDRDTVARTQVGALLQVGGEGRGQAVELGVAQGDAHVAVGRAVGEFLAGALEHLDHRLVGGQVDLAGHASRAFVVPEIRLHCCCPLT